MLLSAILPKARAITREALGEIARNPNETVAVAATRPTDRFRAAIVDLDRPHATEMSFFGNKSQKIISKKTGGDSAPCYHPWRANALARKLPWLCTSIKQGSNWNNVPSFPMTR